MEKADKALTMASGIAKRGACGLEDAQASAFEKVDDPSSSVLRATVAELKAAQGNMASCS